MSSKYRKNQRGASLLEYSQILALVLIISLPTIKLIGHATTQPFCNVGTKLITQQEIEWKLADGTVGSKTKCKSKFGFDKYFEISW